MFDFASHLSNIASHSSDVVSLLSTILKLVLLLFVLSILWRSRKIIIKLLMPMVTLLRSFESLLIARSLPTSDFDLTSFDWKYWCVVWSGIYEETYVTETRKQFVEISPGTDRDIRQPGGCDGRIRSRCPGAAGSRNHGMWRHRRSSQVRSLLGGS